MRRGGLTSSPAPSRLDSDVLPAIADGAVAYGKGIASIRMDKLAVAYGKGDTSVTMDYPAVAFGTKIIKILPGYISTEVDARLSLHTEATITKALQLIKMYKEVRIKKE